MRHTDARIVRKGLGIPSLRFICLGSPCSRCSFHTDVVVFVEETLHIIIVERPTGRS